MKRIRQLYDAATAGNATLEFSPTTGKTMRVLCGQVNLTTNATVANRRVILAVIDPATNTVIDIHSGAVVAASQTNQHHEFMQGVYRETSFVGGALQVPIPIGMYVPTGFILRVSVTAGVAGDSFSANFLVEED